MRAVPGRASRPRRRATDVALAQRVLALVAWSLAVVGCSGGGGTPASANAFYSTKKPYAPEQDLSSYESPPPGYRPVFTQMVTRHGARALTSATDIDYVEQLIDYAEADGALTTLGGALRPQVVSLEEANVAVGYGNLSGLGVEELEELAARLLARLPDLFRDAAATGRRVMIVNSGKERAVDSGNHFAASLAAHLPALARVIDPPITNPQLLYFFKLNPEYLEWLAHDPTLHARLNEIYDSPTSHRQARRMLGRLFDPSFVDELAAGQFTFTDPDTGESVVLNDVDLAVSLYDLYQIAPGLREEGSWQFDRFVPIGPAAWFAYVSDAEQFYQKGPSFAGSAITFAMAQVLEDDFFAAVGANCSDHGSLVADLRFAHAETIIPLAALMRLPSSDEQVPASRTYRYADNPWRGDQVAPYAANIQWDAYGDDTGDCLVRMLYNEKQTRFKASCRSIRPKSFYYDLGELRRCYGYPEQQSSAAALEHPRRLS